MIMHCHILYHEDSGMMALLDAVEEKETKAGEGGLVFEPAEPW